MLKNTILASAVAFGALLAGACTSTYHGAALIETVPEGANVVEIDSGSHLGTTPFMTRWEEQDSVQRQINVVIKRDGYVDKSTTFYVTLKHSSRQAAESDPNLVRVTLTPISD
ncbi:hypothetical protein OAS86_06330 [Gammaproteobacteria bacterium]|nr:hypothetical protein [Gammaproteobacteria bacterium]